jgi:tetratricopeptide (TPR) repeat protein
MAVVAETRFAWVVAIAIALSAARADAQSPVDVEQARALAKEGLSLSRQSRWEEAIAKLERSLGLHRAAFTLYSLGVAYKAAGRPAEALGSLRQFLVERDKQEMKRFEAPARAAVDELQGEVGYLTIRVAPADAVVRLDGDVVPAAALGLPRLSNPGARILSAEARGYRRAMQTVDLARGETREVSLELEPAPSDAPVAPGDDKSAFPIAPLVVMGIGVAALGAGIAVGLVGVKRAEDAPTRDGAEAEKAKTLATVGDVVATSGSAVAAGDQEDGTAWRAVPGGAALRF